MTTINQDNLFQYYGRIKIYATPDLLAFSTGLAIDNRTVLTHLTPLDLKDVKVKSVTFSIYDPRMKKFDQPIDVEMLIAADTSENSMYDLYMLRLKNGIDTLEKFNLPIHIFIPDNYFFYNFDESKDLKQIKINVNPHDESDEKFIFFDAESVFVKSIGSPLLTKIDNHFFLTGIYIGIRSSSVYPYRENCGIALKISDAVQNKIALMRKVSLLKWHELAEDGDLQDQVSLRMFYAQGHGVPQDLTQAVRYYMLAADQGHAEAQTHLKMIYAQGQDVDQIK